MIDLSGVKTPAQISAGVDKEKFVSGEKKDLRVPTEEEIRPRFEKQG